jgi:hypothetical protein
MNRQIVLTGMHRSGTSLLAGAAVRAGVDMGDRLMAASKGNRHGHFEDLDFVHFHERMLEARGWSALRPPAEPLLPSPEEEAEARAAVRAELPLWGFKDPRTSLFLDLWNRALPAPFFLLVYRHPVEVALSLLRRGLDVEVQLDPGVAIRSWRIYNARLLEFRRAYPDRCLLWHIRGAAGSLTDAFGRLGARLGVNFQADVEAAFVPADLRTGLWARAVDWREILPDAMELYADLESAADLPGGPEPVPWEAEPRPSTIERELHETAEHLLARTLARPAGEVPAQLRVDYSELRLLADRQEERLQELERRAAGEEERRRRAETLRERNEEKVRRLSEELRAWEARWAGLEETRGFRLLHSYWHAAERARRWWGGNGRKANGRKAAREDAAKVLVGCVTEDQPAMLADTLRLVQSIRWFGGSMAQARFMVCSVDSIAPEARRAFEGYGAEVRVVPRFDIRNGSANKLRFLEEAVGETGVETILLMDCDTVVVRDPLPFFPPGALAAKVGDVASVTHEAFENLFRHFGLPMPPRSLVTTLLDEPTIPYFNTGIAALPAALARSLVPVWADYNRRILDVRDELMGSCAHHSHQASLPLALAAHPVPVAEAPVEINFPLHLTHIPPPQPMLDADPAILHYHKLVDADGFLLPCPYPRAQERIEIFNRRLRQEREQRDQSGQPAARAVEPSRP